MGKKVSVLQRIANLGPYVTFGIMCIGLVVHIAGLCTGHWLYGETEPANNTSQDTALQPAEQKFTTSAGSAHHLGCVTGKGDITRVTVGLVSQTLEYKNSTKDVLVSSLTILSSQYVMLAISCLSCVLAAIILVKPIHVIVGTSGFISTTLMFVCVVVFKNDMNENLLKIQIGYSNWPPLRLSWSCDLVQAGLLISSIANFLFLMVQLVKSELEWESKRPKSDIALSKIHRHVAGISRHKNITSK